MSAPDTPAPSMTQSMRDCGLGLDRANRRRSAGCLRAGDRRAAGVRPLSSIRRDAITWAEEVIVYIAVWAVMIVASDLVRTNGHVRPDLVLRLLRPQAQRWVEVFNCLVALGFYVRHGVVRLGCGEHRAAAGSAEFIGPAVPDVDLLPGAAGWRRADVDPLSGAAVPVHVPV